MRSFLEYFMEKLNYPAEARDIFLSLDGKISRSPETNRKIESMAAEMLADREMAIADLDADAAALGTVPSTLQMLFYMRAAEPLRELYGQKGVEERYFWDAMTDLRCKLLECHEVRGEWGTAAGRWHAAFYRMRRFALGRLQFEEIIYRDAPYDARGVSLREGNSLFNMHIPSSGPLTGEAKLDSHKRAYDFYGCAERGAPFVCYCNSWLLYPDNEYIFPEGSNLLDFYHDFDIISHETRDSFGDGWRVFGREWQKPPDELPADTSLRRAYIRWLSAGGRTGMGRGVAIFDGKKILTGKRR